MSTTSAATDDKQVCFQRLECPLCVWYLVKLADADEMIEKLLPLRTNQFNSFEMKLDTDQWSSVSERFGTLSKLLQQVRQIYDGAKEDDQTLISLRLYWREPFCRTMAINPASHRCKVCVHDYVSHKTGTWKPLANPSTLHFACSSAAQIVDNARQTQEHMSRLAHYRDGDGTFYPTTAISKPADPPGQSLLKQALRVARGEPADGSGTTKSVLRPPFQTFTTQRYPLVSPAVVPGSKVLDARLRQDNARPADCAEDEFDIDLRQMGNWYEQHFSGKPSRQDYFIATAQAKGVSKFDIVAALSEQ